MARQEKPDAVKLALPNAVKEVSDHRPGLLAVENVITAIEFTAALARPEAINHRFFPNL